jgi:hypothetical protein
MSDRRLQDASWHKSTYSGGQNACVETAAAEAVIGVRDTKHSQAGVIVVPLKAWAAFIGSVTAR